MIVAAVIENAKSPDQVKDECDRPKREGLRLEVWRALPNSKDG
ncbi:hypothetical protein [Nocardia acidivorans]|nr:hypothetical protein [Nocardia acidivorans]